MPGALRFVAILYTVFFLLSLFIQGFDQAAALFFFSAFRSGVELALLFSLRLFFWLPVVLFFCATVILYLYFEKEVLQTDDPPYYELFKSFYVFFFFAGVLGNYGLARYMLLQGFRF